MNRIILHNQPKNIYFCKIKISKTLQINLFKQVNYIIALNYLIILDRIAKVIVILFIHKLFLSFNNQSYLDMSKLLIIFGISLVSFATTYLILTNTHSCNCLNNIFFCDIPAVDLTTQASKWLVIRSLLSKIALFLFVHAMLVMTLRILTKKSSPATEEDTTSIKVLNRIISNTIEQSLIFVGLYVYFLVDRSGDRFTSSELLTIASWFLLSRVIFSISYIIGQLIELPLLRAFGFALNITVNVLLIELVFSDCGCISKLIFNK